jgi:hypothetical protein
VNEITGKYEVSELKGWVLVSGITGKYEVSGLEG